MDERSSPLDPGLAGAEARPVPGVDNGFVAGYRVRFDEAGPDGLAHTAALLRYAQDVAWRHSEALGFDRAWYASRGLAWVVRGIDFEVLAPIPVGHVLRVTTAVVGHRRIWARRLGAFSLVDGALAARVTTDWLLLDARGRIVRIPHDFGVVFASPEIAAEIVRVEVQPEAVPVARLELQVRPSDLDPMGHVNNAVYLDSAEEGLLASGWGNVLEALPRRCRIEYASPAEAGGRIQVAVHGTPADWAVRIARDDGSDLARVRGRAG